MITELSRVIELKQPSPGIWYARVTFTCDDGSEEGAFLKFKQADAPSEEQVAVAALGYAQAVNTPHPDSLNPLALISDLPEAPSASLWQRVLDRIKSFFLFWRQ
jgi:hypothetical protein